MRKWTRVLLAIVVFVTMFLISCGKDDALIVFPGGKFLYVNADAGGVNFVVAFAINRDGTLTEITGSPFATGGAGRDGGYYASNPIAIAKLKRLLFASNKADSTITVFRLNMTTGALTAIGAPVASGGTMGGGGSLAVDRNEKFLFVGHEASGNIAVFRIGQDGSLTAVAGSPFALSIGTADGINLNIYEGVLYVAGPESNAIAALNVEADGSLTEIPGSPFATTNVTSFATISRTLGLSAAAGNQDLISWDIDGDGAITQNSTLPITTNNQCVTTARSGKLAILSGGWADTIHVISVATDGTLAQVAGSPFATADSSTGYAVATPNNNYVYASGWNNTTNFASVMAFAMDANGVLTAINIYPLTGGFATGLAIY